MTEGATPIWRGRPIREKTAIALTVAIVVAEATAILGVGYLLYAHVGLWAAVVWVGWWALVASRLDGFVLVFLFPAMAAAYEAVDRLNRGGRA